VSLARNYDARDNGNLGAQTFDMRSDKADHIVRHLERRAGEVAGDRRVGSRVREQLDSILDLWAQEQRRPASRLVYKAPRNSSDQVGLLRGPETPPWRRTTCPTSLREVEPGIRLVLRAAPGEGGDEEHPYLPQQPSADSQEEARP
jgi:hypothetical protein